MASSIDTFKIKYPKDVPIVGVLLMRVAVYYGCCGALAGSRRRTSSCGSALRRGGLHVTVPSPFLRESRIEQRRFALRAVHHRPRARGHGLRGGGPSASG